MRSFIIENDGLGLHESALQAQPWAENHQQTFQKQLNEKVTVCGLDKLKYCLVRMPYFQEIWIVLRRQDVFRVADNAT